jgi:hypothetical protein
MRLLRHKGWRFYGPDGADLDSFGAAAITSSGGSLEVKEADGSPDVSNVTLITVTNGTLTDNGGGSISLNLNGTGGGGSESWHPFLY